MKIFTFLLTISLFLGSAPAETKLKRVDSPALGGDQRYLAHVSTDKPIYREGEKVYLRSVLLHVADRTPYSDAASAIVTIKGPKGDQVFQTRSTLEPSSSGLLSRRSTSPSRPGAGLSTTFILKSQHIVRYFGIYFFPLHS